MVVGELDAVLGLDAIELVVAEARFDGAAVGLPQAAGGFDPEAGSVDVDHSRTVVPLSSQSSGTQPRGVVVSLGRRIQRSDPSRGDQWKVSSAWRMRSSGPGSVQSWPAFASRTGQRRRTQNRRATFSCRATSGPSGGAAPPSGRTRRADAATRRTVAAGALLCRFPRLPGLGAGGVVRAPGQPRGQGRPGLLGAVATHDGDVGGRRPSYAGSSGAARYGYPFGPGH